MLRNLFKIVFFPLFGPMRPKPARPAPRNGAQSVDPDRVHVFAGSFPSEVDATDYCLTPMGRNKPEPLTRDLPDAMIDTAEVEIIFGAARITAALPMLSPRPNVGKANTIVLIAEAAFGGLPYSLADTPKLRYLGPAQVS